MCGRFFVDAKNREIDRLTERLGPRIEEIKLGEVFPTNKALVLAKGDGGFAPRVMAWGFPRWDGKGSIINARAESALAKPFFREALLASPLVIPASGFYEWRPNPATGRKDKYYFYAPGEEPIYLAAFGERFPDSPADGSFVALTTAANESVEFCHARMPLLFAGAQIDAWLNGDDPRALLAVKPAELLARKVD